MFVLQERDYTVYDSESKTEVRLERAGAGSQYYDVVCSSPKLGRFVFFLSLEDKYESPPNLDVPTIKIYSKNLDSAFRRKKMLDENYNSRLIRYLCSGIAELSRIYPLTRSPVMYSDYEENILKGENFVFKMPSDKELIQISKINI